MKIDQATLTVFYYDGIDETLQQTKDPGTRLEILHLKTLLSLWDACFKLQHDMDDCPARIQAVHYTYMLLNFLYKNPALFNTKTIKQTLRGIINELLTEPAAGDNRVAYDFCMNMDKICASKTITPEAKKEFSKLSTAIICELRLAEKVYDKDKKLIARKTNETYINIFNIAAEHALNDKAYDLSSTIEVVNKIQDIQIKTPPHSIAVKTAIGGIIGALLGAVIAISIATIIAGAVTLSSPIIAPTIGFFAGTGLGIGFFKGVIDKENCRAENTFNKLNQYYPARP